MIEQIQANGHSYGWFCRPVHYVIYTIRRAVMATCLLYVLLVRPSILYMYGTSTMQVYKVASYSQ